MSDDRFESASIRHRVLTSWSASPARFREDANAEEDLVLGGYRDRVIIELAQNAADAAARSGRPGRLLLALRSPTAGAGSTGAIGEAGSAGSTGATAVLVAANTGNPLDQAGVQALATLRASAKRDGDTVGRFGVGFAAVLAVSDEPVVISRSGGVRFSAVDTLGLVRAAGEQAPDLAAELARRDAHVPVLRLPFPAEGAPPDGYDTEVLLPLRDPAAEELVLQLLEQVADPLLLALPALAEIVIELPGREPRVLRDVTDRWHVLRREGRLPAQVRATRPTEERGHDRWQVTWALPRIGHTEPRAALPNPLVVHAPTPSDEPLPWPALLIATLPLDTSRRHVSPGPVTDALIQAAADAYAELLAERAGAGEPAWPLIPTGLPVGVLDGQLRAAVHQLLPETPILASAEDPTLVLRPRDALALLGPVGAEPTTVAGFASWLAGLVLAPRAAAAAFERLGVRRISLAEAVEMLPPVADPARWQRIYAALAPLAIEAEVREALAFLPVPLAGGAVVRGMRGLLLPPAGPSGDADLGSATRPDSAAALAVLAARVVHPDAVHPLLERLGAIPAGPRALLELPAVQAAVAALTGDGGRDLDAPSDEERVDAILALTAAAVEAGELSAGDLPWLGDLVLPDDAGDPTPAAALALPGSPASRWFAAAEIGVVEAALVARWGPDVLVAVGVLAGPGILRAQDVPLDSDDLEFDPPVDAPAVVLDGWDDWVAMIVDAADLGESVDESGFGASGFGASGLGASGLGASGLGASGLDAAVVSELVAVRDLDAVRPGALPEVIAAIAADPVLRPALVAPARIVVDGRSFDVPSYTSWWLRSELSALESPSQLPSTGERGALAGPDADPVLRALLPMAPDWILRLDPGVQRALGVLSRVEDLDPLSVPVVLARLADDDLELSADLLVVVFTRIAVLAGSGLRIDRPTRLRGLAADGEVVLADLDDVVVLEAPMYRQRPDLGVHLPVAPRLASALADLLDLPLAGELAAGGVEEGEPDEDAPGLGSSVAGELHPTTIQLRRLLPHVPDTWCEHDQLFVDGIEVDWWVQGEGEQAQVHAATTDGLARGLAWAAGRWELRSLVAGLLAEPETAVDLTIDQVFAP